VFDPRGILVAFVVMWGFSWRSLSDYPLNAAQPGDASILIDSVQRDEPLT
jgi:hypothetical protein